MAGILITPVMMTPLVLLALVALLVRDGQWAVRAWVLMALAMVPVWLLLGLPLVAVAQAVLGAGVTGWLLWRSHRDAEVGP